MRCRKVEKKKIERINELARKAKSVGLTEAERSEQTQLRNEYRVEVIGSLTGELENTFIMTPDGKKKKVERKF